MLQGNEETNQRQIQPHDMNEHKDRIDKLVNKVADIKYDLQVVLDELYQMQHENEEE